MFAQQRFAEQVLFARRFLYFWWFLFSVSEIEKVRLISLLAVGNICVLFSLSVLKIVFKQKETTPTQHRKNNNKSTKKRPAPDVALRLTILSDSSSRAFSSSSKCINFIILH
ncbi:hypothetical protein [Enterobacter cloacae]|uniref:hypothetical protein n=1 Tax=Enterobacter cloacae TaxID=550 RepID=UPI00388F3037